MKVRLLKTARITHDAGEIVEVSPDQAAFLLSVGSAEPVVAATREKPEKATTKTTRKK